MPFGIKSMSNTAIYKIINTFVVLCGTALAVASSTQQIGSIMHGVGGVKGLAVRWLFVIALFTLAGLSVLIFKYRFLEKSYAKLRQRAKIEQALIVAFGMLCASRYVGKFYEYAYIYAEHLNDTQSWWYHLPYAYGKVPQPLGFTPPRWIFSFALFVPVTIFYTYFIMELAGVIKGVLATLTKSERKFMIIGSVVSVLYIVVLYNLSNIYYAPVLRDTTKILGSDTLYNLDSGVRIRDSRYADVLTRRVVTEHLALEPFILPFVVIAQSISIKPLYYGIINGALQLLMLLFSALLISRMAVKERKLQISFLIFICSTFPFLILSTGIEIYTFATFWLVIALYESGHGRNAIFWASGSAGAVITNGLSFLTAIKTRRSAVKDLFLQGGVFLLILCCLQGISTVLSMNFTTRYFAMNSNIFERFKHFSVFAKGTLFVSGPVFINLNSDKPAVAQEIVSSVSVIGVIVLAAVIAGFVLNYKNRLAIFAFLWVLVSYAGIGILGWSLAEVDQVVVFGIYFSWAYTALIYMAIDKLFKNREKREKRAVLLLLAAACLAVNGKAVIDILRFGMEYYPVR